MSKTENFPSPPYAAGPAHAARVAGPRAGTVTVTQIPVMVDHTAESQQLTVTVEGSGLARAWTVA